MAPSNRFTELDLHPNSLHLLGRPPAQLLHHTHHYRQLQRLLEAHDLIIVPADKQKYFVVLTHQAYLTALSRHLSDRNTYSQITDARVVAINKVEARYLAGAVTFFNDRQLFCTDKNERYFFGLPKTHKQPVDWPIPFECPKFRPILSNSCSNTSRLAKKLLPFIQRLESQFKTIVHSSMAVVDRFESFLSTLPLYSPHLSNVVLVSIDIEEMYTNIPLTPLFEILRDLLPSVHDKPLVLLHYLRLCTNFTYFSAGGNTFLQTRGLPMGGSLSGSLANLYVAHLEQPIVAQFQEHILAYFRYADDILVIFRDTERHLQNFLSLLQETLHLKLSTIIHPVSATFLDLHIHFSINSGFSLSLHSKNPTLFQLPSKHDNRPRNQLIGIAKSQFLRLWRLSTNNDFFNAQITHVRHSLPSTGLSGLFEQTLREFFSPVESCTGLFLTQHQLCPICMHFAVERALSIRKVLLIPPTLIASRQPVSCTTSSISFIVSSPPSTNFILIQSMSIHSLLPSVPHFSQILPLGVTDDRKDLATLSRSALISCNSLPRTNRFSDLDPFPPTLHTTCANMTNAYGIPCNRRATLKASSVLNQFKKSLRSSTYKPGGQ